MFEYEYSGKLAIINLAIWIILIALYNSQFFCHNPKKNRGYFILGILVSLFTTFGFSEADTYHYHGIYDEMLHYHYPIHVEQFYYWLIDFLPSNYYLWRFVIWTVALVLLIKAFKRLNLDPSAVCFVFPMVLLQQFTVTRGCLGISLFLYSYSLIVGRSKNKILSFVIGVVGCIGAIFLHRSMPIFIIIFLASLVPLNKYTILIIILTIPVARTVVMPYVNDILQSDLINSNTSDFAVLYLEGQKSEVNINGVIRMLVDYFPRIMIVFILIKDYFWKGRYISYPMKILLQYTIVLFFVAILFLGQETSSFVTNRTIHMMTFPLTFVMSYYLMQEKRHKIIMKVTMLGFMLADLYAFAHTIYKNW